VVQLGKAEVQSPCWPFGSDRRMGSGERAKFTRCGSTTNCRAR